MLLATALLSHKGVMLEPAAPVMERDGERVMGAEWEVGEENDKDRERTRGER